MSHKIEEAKIERLNLPIGEADIITVPHNIPNYGMGTYGEVYCTDPFTLRIHRICERAFAVGDVSYKGVLSTPLQKNEEGFKRFSDIAEKLESTFGKSILHKLEDYVATLDRGLGVPLYADHPNFFVRPKAKIGFPKFPDLFKKYNEKSFKRTELRRIEEKGFLLGKVIEEHQMYEETRKSIDNVDKCRIIRHKLDDYFHCFKELCQEGRWYEGLIVEYEEQNLQNVFDFFNYVLRGGNIPNLPNINPASKTQKPEEKPIETKPTEEKFIDPWKIKIPKLGGKKNDNNRRN